MGVATHLYADDNVDKLPYAWATGNDPNRNNFETLLVKYIKPTAFNSSTNTATSDFAVSVFRCPIRLLENHWQNYKNYAGIGNPWKISYGMNQYTSADFPASIPAGQPPNGTTARMGSVRQPTDTLLIADLSFLLNRRLQARRTPSSGGRQGEHCVHGRARRRTFVEADQRDCHGVQEVSGARRLRRFNVALTSHRRLPSREVIYRSSARGQAVRAPTVSARGRSGQRNHRCWLK